MDVCLNVLNQFCSPSLAIVGVDKTDKKIYSSQDFPDGLNFRILQIVSINTLSIFYNLLSLLL